MEEKEHGNIETSFDYFLKWNLPKNLYILDVGCRFGSLISKIYNAGYNNVWGVDVDEDSILFGRQKYAEISDRLLLYDGKILPFKDKFFDIVLMFDVIEHVKEIRVFLGSQVYRVLKDKGIFIFQTPNKYINIPWEIISKKSFTEWKNYHYSLQTYNSLLNLLKSSGFRDIIIEKFNVLTDYNKERARKHFGILGEPLLKVLQNMPSRLTSNFWGSCRK